MNSKKILSLLVIPLALTSCNIKNITIKEALEIFNNMDKEAAIDYVTTIDYEITVKEDGVTASHRTVLDYTIGSRYYYMKVVSYLSAEVASYEESGKYYTCASLFGGCKEIEEAVFETEFAKYSKKEMITTYQETATEWIDDTFVDYADLSNEEMATMIKGELMSESGLEISSFSYALTNPDDGIEFKVDATLAGSKNFKTTIHSLINKYGLPEIIKVEDEQLGRLLSTTTTYNKAVTRAEFELL